MTRPETVGIRSEDLLEYVQALESAGLATHDVIISRYGKTVFEKYWAPFHRDYLHRMYSASKSFVALAIGFLEQDGLIELDAPMIRYFPEELKHQENEDLRMQTVRQMLMMSTARDGVNWFPAHGQDRVRLYFSTTGKCTYPAGAFFRYDSCGSFVLGALVERITGKKLLDYLREKVLNQIGFSKEARFLQCPGGHSWGDSALLCKATDLLKTAQFCLDRGKYNGVQLLNEAFVCAATTKQIDNNTNELGHYDTMGYGYQFWMTYGKGFCFYGMGCQLAVCVPEKDMILVYNGDNQGNEIAKSIIIDQFYHLIVDRAQDTPIEEHDGAYHALEEYTAGLKLHAAEGSDHSELCEKINHVQFALDPNPMGITQLRLDFAEDSATLWYCNEQGEKSLPFGLCHNVISAFPQDGYSDEVGGVPGNRRYTCAASGAWVTPTQLRIMVQIIDTYFGNLTISIGFPSQDRIGLIMVKTAENFLDEYEGSAGGRRK